MLERIKKPTERLSRIIIQLTPPPTVASVEPQSTKGTQKRASTTQTRPMMKLRDAIGHLLAKNLKTHNTFFLTDAMFVPSREKRQTWLDTFGYRLKP
jgi:hypothetical protein